jgi:hypothetical protein
VRGGQSCRRALGNSWRCRSGPHELPAARRFFYAPSYHDDDYRHCHRCGATSIIQPTHDHDVHCTRSTPTASSATSSAAPSATSSAASSATSSAASSAAPSAASSATSPATPCAADAVRSRSWQHRAEHYDQDHQAAHCHQPTGSRWCSVVIQPVASPHIT